LIGLDRCREILSWPLDKLDPVRRSMRMQVLRVILRIGIKAHLDGKLGRGCQRSQSGACFSQRWRRICGIPTGNRGRHDMMLDLRSLAG
jgi:hypothetical protein